MEIIRFWQMIRNIWRDAWGFIRDRPVFSLIITLLMLAIMYLNATLSLARLAASTAALPHPPTFSLPTLLLIVASYMLHVGLLVQVIRHVTLEDANRPARLFGNAFWGFLGVGFALGILALVFMLVVAMVLGALVMAIRHGVEPTLMRLGFAIVLLPAIGFMMFAWVRLSLLLTQAAVRRPIQWRSAWQDSKGHFWSITASYIAAEIPVGLAFILLMIPFGVTIGIASHVFHAMSVGTTRLWFFCLTSLIQTLATIALMFVGGSCRAWIYRRFANQLLIPVDSRSQ